jgi:tetratricopeptide (TPR) repeat protein
MIKCWVIGLCVAGIHPSMPPAQGAPARPAAEAPAATSQAGKAADRESDAYYQFLLGRHLESTGDIEDAIKAFQQAALADPRSAEIPAELAALYARQDRPHDAISSAEAALKLDPANFEAHRVLGMVHAALARPDDQAFATDPEAMRQAAEAIRHLEAASRVPNRTPDPDLQLLLGRLYLATRQAGKAVPVLEELLGQEGDVPAIVRPLVEAYVSADRLGDAVSLLDRAALGDPRLYATLGELHERAQHWKEAASAYEKALKSYPSNNALKTHLALALLSIPGGEGAARARDLLSQVLADSPADVRAIFLMAQAQRALKDLDGAEKTARRLMELTPTSTSGPEILAQIYSERGEPDKVITLLEPLVEPGASGVRAADTTPLLVALGFAYHDKGLYDRAVATFEAARKLAPSDPALPVYLVQAQLDAGQTQAALDQIRELRAQGVDDLRLERLEAEAERRAGRVDRGVEVLKRAIAARPGDAAGYLALAELYIAAQRFDEALGLLRDAEQRFPKDLDIVFQQGAALERSKRYDEAAAVFERVIAADPLHALALNYLGYMLADRGERLDEAIGYIKRALAIEPGNGAYLDSLGWAYFKQHKLDLAEQYLGPAAASRVRDSAIQDHYGDLLAQQGRHAEAVAAWERALAGDLEQVDRSAIEKKIRTAKGKITKR